MALRRLAEDGFMLLIVRFDVAQITHGHVHMNVIVGVARVSVSILQLEDKRT